MEKYVINRNNPKTEPYVLIGSRSGDVRYVKLSQNYENCVELTISSKEALKLLCIGDIIVFRKISGTDSNKNNWGVYVESETTVVDIEGNTVTVTIPDNREVLHIISTHQEGDDEGGKPGTIYLDGNGGFLPEDFVQYSSETMASITATTTYVPSESDGTECAQIEPWTLNPVYRKFDGDYNYNPDYDRSLINTYAYGTGDECIERYPLPIDFVTEINKYFFEVNEETYHLFDSVEVVKKMVYYEVKTPFYAQDELNLLQQNTITDLFSQEIKEGVIPDFIDMEKLMFEPVIDKSGLMPCNEIVFNFHFRERNSTYKQLFGSEITECVKKHAVSGVSDEIAKRDNIKYLSSGNTDNPEYFELVYDDGWSVNDNRWWNYIDNTKTLTLDAAKKSDPVGCLNFTRNDIRYQKMKVKKSFVRLSFYDSNNPLTQQLLYYSTIFLDSGVLFGDLVKTQDTCESVVFDSVLPTSISVKNKYNTDKSSEGFYLYLFNNEVEPGQGKKEIYMKVEFNHAGYGRTIPMLKPNVNSDGKITTTNMESYYSQQYIKLAIKSFKTGDVRNVYYVDEENTFGIVVDEENKRIIFNLFEVKLT